MTDAKQQPKPRGDVVRGLIEKLEGAAEGSREMDCALGVLVDDFVIDGERYGEPAYCHTINDTYMRPGQSGDMMVPPYSTSIDAALALIERRLPGWGFVLETDAPEFAVRIGPPEGPWPAEEIHAKTPALALCIALLQALTPQVEGGE